MNMNFPEKHTFKLLLMSFCALLLIILNVGSIIEIISSIKSKKEYYYINPIYFYDVTFPDILLKSKNGSINVPDNNNHLIFNVSSISNVEKEMLEKYVNYPIDDSFDIDVILIKRNRGIFNKMTFFSDNTPFYYYTSVVDSFFHTDYKNQFTVLIDSTNKVKYFDYRIINEAEIQNLLENYKK